MAAEAIAANRTSHYDAVSRAAHWLTFALVVAQFAVGWLMPEIGWGTEPTGLIGVHLILGASLLVVVAFRLLWRITQSAPRPLTLMPRWQRLAARATHVALYLLLVAMSLAGWASSSAREWPVKAFGVIPLPALVASHAKIGFILGDWHADVLSWALLVLIGVHVAAALHHRFIKRDEVLQRMLPSVEKTTL